MTLPHDYEMRKLLQDQSDLTLREYSTAIQAEIERRKDESRKGYEFKLAVLFQHMKEEGFNAYFSLPGYGCRKLDIEDIEICGDGEL